MIALLHRSVGYEALILFVVVLAACLAAYRLLLAPPSADRARRQRPPARAAGALLCKRPGCSARANPANGVLVCDAHMELLLCLREDARLEQEDESA